MTVAITVAHNEARLAGTLAFLDTGSNACVRIYGGTRAATVNDAPGSAMLVEVTLTKPAGTIADNKLTMTQAQDGTAINNGTATWARIVNGNGATVMDVDCTDANGSGEVKLPSVQIFAGGDTKITSAQVG